MVTLLLFTTLLTSCSSTPDPNGPPRYADRLKIAVFDATPRAATSSVDVFDETTKVTRPYKIIAQLGRNAKPTDSSLIINAIAWRARQMGADAIILLPAQSTGWKVNNRWGNPSVEQTEPIYNANAIIYTDR